jgi:hypothetical protein
LSEAHTESAADQGPEPERARIRSLASFVALVAGVALCVHAGASLFIPAAFLVVLLPLEKARRSKTGYVLLLSVSVAAAILIGVAWAVITHRSATNAVLVASGLIFASLARLQAPGRTGAQ